MSERPLVIYHANCPDGFTAAWVAHLHFGGRAELVPAFYGTAPPDVADREVLIVDFSYPRATLFEMAGEAESLRVFDHHKTAAEDLADVPFAVFDMERSGAGITWDELQPDVRGFYHVSPVTGRPWIVDYVEDRDLWRFKLADSRDVSDAIMAEPMNVGAWSTLARRPLNSVIRDGRVIRKKIDGYVDAMKRGAWFTRFVDGDGVPRVFPVINAPQVMISDLLHALCIESERAGHDPMALGWFQRGDGVFQFSLRSVGEIDVSHIAKSFGGGGHRNAAGFQSDTFPAFKRLEE